ncbi:LytTR family DNA-binding domain-containing protein [Candidatus Stoquefichus sp. SB1]|jgi:DNA-binding LytR/AlgR family response regulator|uniref:LytTR family DNA-binding domain-containing protein n=1 Tax=Candidatus Stoquefichus sp. SB1 TaxID=1658109 RepID=UPI00067EF512|nr:LytTR family DNA-binding domain-containing protein [Candidatus Stoquefichus sp. SB1]
MKLICLDQHRQLLEDKLKDYQYLDVILVEKGIDFQGLAYVFDLQHLQELQDYLYSLEMSSQVLFGKKNERIYKIDVHTIVYIEGFSKEAYIHTREEQYEIKEKLYELENILSEYGFVRISKSLIINCYMIDSLEPLMNMKYRIYLKNGEYVELSRSYVRSFKNYLKMR